MGRTLCQAEIELTTPDGTACRNQGIAGGDHCHIFFGLVGEEATFAFHITGKGRVAVKVILADVKEHCNLRMKGFHGVELEAAHFRYCQVKWFFLIAQGNKGITNVSTYEDPLTVVLEHISHQGCCGGLAIGSTYGNDRQLEEATGQFQFPHNRD